MRKFSLLLVSALIFSPAIYAAPCAFDGTKNCELQRDILNDIGTNGLKYYSATNYDHRKSGEINVFDYTLTQPYVDTANKPGQVKFLANKINAGFWKSGEFMTRADLHLPPYNAPKPSNPWTTKEIKHGYLEVVVKMPKCDTSSDGKCQAGTQTDIYQSGLWPAIWLLPTNDINWPTNGEIDISEAYLRNTDFKTSTGAIHFFGTDPRCGGNDCRIQGVPLTRAIASAQLWKAFHTWGFEWEPDPASTKGGHILTGYFDNVKLWGPLKTDSLPADGPGALQRGFNDPNGGYYLIVNLALGGGYAGAPYSQMLSSSMYVQSAKAYTVGTDTPPPPPPPPPPPGENGIVRINVSDLSDSQCLNLTDQLFIDQEQVGQSFTVTPSACTYKWLPVGLHQVRLTSQVSIPAGSTGVCTSTLDKTEVQITANMTSAVLATYKYKPNTTGQYAYNVVLGYPFLKVLINGTIPCPGPSGSSKCLISNQAPGSTMTIKGQSTNFCNLLIQANGSIVVGAGSSRCFVVTTAATPTTPGKINVPGGF